MMDYFKLRNIIQADATLTSKFETIPTERRANLDVTARQSVADIEAYFDVLVTIDQDVDVSEFAAHLELTSLVEKVQAASSNAGLPAGIKAVAAKILRLVGNGSPITRIQMTVPAIKTVIETMLTALVSAGVWEEEEVAGVLALGLTEVPRWQAENLGERVDIAHLVLMRQGRA